jgi:hypothetical protein
MTKVSLSYFLAGTSHSFHGRLGSTAETFCGISLCLEINFHLLSLLEDNMFYILTGMYFVGVQKLPSS